MVKTQIVSIDGGVHNRDLEQSTVRVLEGSSWKKTRVVMVIPAGPSIPPKVYLNHRALIFPPNQPVHFMAALGMEVGEAYSTAIAEVVNHPELGKWEYLLTIEHDNMPPVDGLLKLIKRMEHRREFACIGGLYWTKGEAGVPQIWGDPADPLVNYRPQVPVPGELVECCGTGMGFNLWRMSTFKDDRLRKPWFKTVAGPEGVGTQDLYFWGDARKYGYRCAVDCDVKVGHYDAENDIIW
jgi:hypothetical protein